MAMVRAFDWALRGMLIVNRPFLKPADTFSLSMSSGRVKLREKLFDTRSLISHSPSTFSSFLSSFAELIERMRSFKLI